MRHPGRYVLAALCAGALSVAPYALGAQNQQYPHSTLDFRVTNRRYVSHILYELIENTHYVTIITTHPGVWAFHANSHALHYKCERPAHCNRILRKLDDFLQTGWNIGLHLNGSEIKEIIYFERPR